MRAGCGLRFLAGRVWKEFYLYRNRLSFGIGVGLFAYDGERVAFEKCAAPNLSSSDSELAARLARVADPLDSHQWSLCSKPPAHRDKTAMNGAQPFMAHCDDRATCHRYVPDRASSHLWSSCYPGSQNRDPAHSHWY
jgi:hypothetical protein